MWQAMYWAETALPANLVRSDYGVTMMVQSPGKPTRQYTYCMHPPRDTDTVPCRGMSEPRHTVTSSTFPALVTAAMTATASPPGPDIMLGTPEGTPATPTPTGHGQMLKVVTGWGRVCRMPRS